MNYVRAEGEISTGNVKEYEQSQDLIEDITNSEQQDNMSSKVGYIQSDLDYNTPVYHHDKIGRESENVPVAYPTDMSAFYTKYPNSRDQNPYGTCWAFSTIGLAEFDLINKGVFNVQNDLSELQLVHFVYNSVVDPLGGTEGDYAKFYNENTDISYLNYGGNYEMASRRLGQWVGAVDETEVPYKDADKVNNNGLQDIYAYDYDIAHLENTYIINIKENAMDVKKQIMEHGAVGTVYINYYSSMRWNEQQQIYTYYDTSSTMGYGGGHAVMIVGWDDNFSKDNFDEDLKPENDGAWLIRNSWGDYCNYFWLSYDTYTLVDSAWVFDFALEDNYDNNYQYDGGLTVYPAQYTTVSNVFTVKKEKEVSYETLKAVSVSFTRAAEVEYSIEIYTNLSDSNNPTSGTKQESATTIGSTEYAGTYTIPLENEVKLEPGSTFSVIVKVNQAAVDYEQAMSIADVDSGITIWECAVSQNNGKSFYKVEDCFYPYNWGNFCVKALTSNVEKTIKEDEYPDVDSTKWYYNTIKYVSEHKLMTGYDEGTFGPENDMSRGEFTTVLYRIAGNPTVEYKESYPDVSRDMFYAKPITWAKYNSVVSGYNDGTFGPNDKITREQLATILYRFEKFSGGSLYAMGDYSKFKDGKQVSEYASEAMKWAIGNGLIKGNDDGRLAPQDNVTRAVCATIIARYWEKSGH